MGDFGSNLRRRKKMPNIPHLSRSSTQVHAASTWCILGDHTAAPPAVVPGCSWGDISHTAVGREGGCRGEINTVLKLGKS